MRNPEWFVTTYAEPLRGAVHATIITTPSDSTSEGVRENDIMLTEIGFRFVYVICSQGTVVLQGTYQIGASMVQALYGCK